VSSFCTVLAPSTDSLAPGAEISGLSTAESILEGAQNIRKSVPFVSVGGSGAAVAGAAGRNEVATATDVADCAARTFDSDTAELATDFVEGTKVQIERVMISKPEHLEKLMTAALALPFKITLAPDVGLKDSCSVELHLTGILSAGGLRRFNHLQ